MVANLGDVSAPPAPSDSITRAVAFSIGVYPGAAGLAELGLAAIGESAQCAGVPRYPHRVRWLRD
jgi:hypothetical protein